jgi:hypothetical protein
MATPAPSRRVNRWIVLSVGIALAAIAANGPRIYAIAARLINPPPADLIIVAPAGSDTV